MRMSTSNSKDNGFFTKKNKKITTQKGEHSCKCTELSLKQKEGIHKPKLFMQSGPLWVYTFKYKHNTTN